MRQLFTALLITTLPIIGFSQLTITASEHNPSVGDTFEQQIVSDPPSGFNAGPAGADVVWDFSSLNASTTKMVNIEANENTDFPDADIFFVQSGISTYFGTSDAAFTYYGISSSDADIIYSDGEEQVRFPMTYEDSYTDSFEGNMDAFGQTLDREGTIDVEADGYGTLITPEATYSNALRVRIIRNTTDYFSGVETGSSVDTIYYWYAPEINFTVMTYFRSYAEDGTYSSSANYLTDDSGVGLVTADPKNDLLSISPNPVQIGREATITAPKNIEKLTVFALDGRKILQRTGKNERQQVIRLDAVPDGVYMIQVHTANTVMTKKLMLTRTDRK